MPYYARLARSIARHRPRQCPQPRSTGHLRTGNHCQSKASLLRPDCGRARLRWRPEYATGCRFPADTRDPGWPRAHSHAGHITLLLSRASRWSDSDCRPILHRFVAARSDGERRAWFIDGRNSRLSPPTIHGYVLVKRYTGSYFRVSLQIRSCLLNEFGALLYGGGSRRAPPRPSVRLRAPARRISAVNASCARIAPPAVLGVFPDGK